ncbi:MAG: hypothetical protein A2622_09345 [Bdellovibrionales bacterium RIFCSPHIGHO2_01_FULL_40_29]|nr:MAG: hypothetical protein A2622_09345 [Bdellovibrionales bacterium RIFCSPHIGHO2_01_FULL_40_29]OFZ33571.1 MAG: hypothetical protein A3D17_00275 [Bdellovibrionales bacterium RIFCSPHIGHO2_02_FULL_40_15]
MSNAIERWFDRKSVGPFRDFSDIQESFDRLFSEVSNLKRSSGMPSMSFVPSCDITEDGNKFIMKFDMPGVTRDQIRVEADKDILTIHAERKEEKKSESKKKYLSEVYYGSYTRSFNLPGLVDEKQIDAKFENGVLTVVVPRTDIAQAKQIPVH